MTVTASRRPLAPAAALVASALVADTGGTLGRGAQGVTVGAVDAGAVIAAVAGVAAVGRLGVFVPRPARAD